MKLSEQVADLEEKFSKYELRCINLQQDKVDLEVRLAEAKQALKKIDKLEQESRESQDRYSKLVQHELGVAHGA